MRSPKLQQSLWVKAVGMTRYIDDNGTPLLNMRFVGRDQNLNVIPEGIIVSYHSFYVKELKDGALVPMDLHTAALAGVPFNQG